MRARRAARSRRRGDDSAATATDSVEEEVGEREGVVGELTTVQFEAEDGRKMEHDVGGAKLRGEVAQLGVRRIEVGRRGLAGATSDGDFARFCSLELDLAQRKEEGGLGRHGKLRGVRERRRAASGAIADAWTRSPATTAAVWASGHSVEHRRGTVCSFK